MLGRTKKQKITIAAVLLFLVFLCLYGVVTYSYKALTTVDNTTTKNGYVQEVEQEEEENFFHKYMDSFYDRLSNSNE